MYSGLHKAEYFANWSAFGRTTAATEQMGVIGLNFVNINTKVFFLDGWGGAIATELFTEGE